jgi:hypothetical protein
MCNVLTEASLREGRESVHAGRCGQRGPSSPMANRGLPACSTLLLLLLWLLLLPPPLVCFAHDALDFVAADVRRRSRPDQERCVRSHASQMSTEKVRE